MRPWQILTVWFLCLVFCLFVWYMLARVAGAMFERLGY